MTRTAEQIAAKIIAEAALEEMVRTSGASVAEIMAVICADPHGATATRFFTLCAIGRDAYASLEAA